MRHEHERLYEGDALLFKGFLSSENALEAFALAIREDDGVFVGLPPPLVVPRPVSGVARQFTWGALDFDEKNTLGTGYKEIHFVDGAVISDKLKIRPRPVIVLCRKLLVDKVQRLLFPGKLGAGHGFPMSFSGLSDVAPLESERTL
jgi:hypothetical protein